MNAISKQQLKQEIDRLDSQYLELAYKILRQFPRHEPSVSTDAIPGKRDPLLHSQAIFYAVSEDIEGATPFAGVTDAAAYVKELRRSQWRRG
jgi:hypothetical protein